MGGFVVLFCFGYCGFWVLFGGNNDMYYVVPPDGYPHFLWRTELDI